MAHPTSDRVSQPGWSDEDEEGGEDEEEGEDKEEEERNWVIIWDV